HPRAYESALRLAEHLPSREPLRLAMQRQSRWPEAEHQRVALAILERFDDPDLGRLALQAAARQSDCKGRLMLLQEGATYVGVQRLAAVDIVSALAPLLESTACAVSRGRAAWLLGLRLTISPAPKEAWQMMAHLLRDAAVVEHATSALQRPSCLHGELLDAGGEAAKRVAR